MKAGLLLRILADVVHALVDEGLINAEGDFVTPTPDQDIMLAAEISAILVRYGVDLPDKVDKAVQLIPLFLKLIE